MRYVAPHVVIYVRHDTQIIVQIEIYIKYGSLQTPAREKRQ